MSMSRRSLDPRRNAHTQVVPGALLLPGETALPSWLPAVREPGDGTLAECAGRMSMDRNEGHRRRGMQMRARPVDQSTVHTNLHPPNPHRPARKHQLSWIVPRPLGFSGGRPYRGPSARQQHPLPLVRHPDNSHRYATTAVPAGAEHLTASTISAPGKIPTVRDQNRLRRISHRRIRPSSGPVLVEQAEEGIQRHFSTTRMVLDSGRPPQSHRPPIF